MASAPWSRHRQTDRRVVPLPIPVNDPLVGPNLAAMPGVVGMRVRAHASTLLELQVIHYKLTEWLRWRRVTERNLWTMWRNKSGLLLQQIGANLKSLHRGEVLRLFSESRRVVARLYHPDDHDCLVLTGPMT